MREYFCGWYCKCQSDAHTLAVIPAFHKTKSKQACSVQLITPSASWSISFPFSAFHKGQSMIAIADNRFSTCGFSLNIHSPKLCAVGTVRFGAFTPIRYDIMGPFRYIPRMECRHSVFSMKHTVSGGLTINGEQYAFDNGVGYLEGDRGRSFPKEYAWTQCHFSEGSLMLSVADIPFGGYHFTGVIGVILWRGKEYRLATYLGAKALKIRDGEIVVVQGKRCLIVKLLEKTANPLCAPIGGAMTRTIRENAACCASYHFQEDGRTLFSFEAPNAAFEYEYPQ